MRGAAVALLAGALLGGAVAPRGAAAQAGPVAIVGGAVHPVDGPALDPGTVVIRDGRIEAVGPAAEVGVPADARRIDAAGKVVTPGLFDAATRTGLVEVGAVEATRDHAVEGDPVRAAFRVTDGIHPRSVVIPVTRGGGVTTVVSAPTGGAVSGQGAVIDLAGATVEAMTVRDPAGLWAAFDEDGAESVGGARGALAMRLRELLEDARFYAENRADYGRGRSRPLSASRLDLEAVRAVLEGRMPLVVRAKRASDIASALRIAGEFGVRLVVEGGEEAWLVAERLAAAAVPVIVKPLTNLPVQFEQVGARYENPALLEAAGVPVVLSTLDTHNARRLRQEAGNAVRFGMSWEGALRAVTLAPAEAFGVGDRYGSLAPGKVANLVVWSGDPFEISTEAERVFIRGEEADLDSRQRRLLERYRELDGRPPQYRGTEPPRPGRGPS